MEEFTEEEKQTALCHDLLVALIATRKNPGLPLQTVAEQLHCVYDEIEIKRLIKELNKFRYDK